MPTGVPGKTSLISTYGVLKICQQTNSLGGVAPNMAAALGAMVSSAFQR